MNSGVVRGGGKGDTAPPELMPRESYRAPRLCNFRQECHKGRKVEQILGILGVIFRSEGNKILEGAKMSFFQL